MPLSPDLKTKIDDLVQKNRVVLFMKGNKHFPQCGFSSRVVNMLKEVGVPFETVNVLADPAIRDGIKEYSNWPTIPQLYVDNTFVGGCDIVTDLFQTGELQTLLGAKAPEPVAPPSITVTAAAAKALQEADDGSGDVLHLEIASDFKYGLFFGPKGASDVVAVSQGTAIHFDAASAKRASGLVVDFVASADGGAFKIDNPNEPAKVKPLSATELKKALDAGEALTLVDVRGEDERRLAKIAAAKTLLENEAEIRALPKDSKIVFQCHHGMRSRAAAERFLAEGFTNVWNLEGGIDAWSVVADPSVARY